MSSRMPVCKFWRAGRCSRRHCPYLHAEPSRHGSGNDGGLPRRRRCYVWKNPSTYLGLDSPTKQQQHKNEGVVIPGASAGSRTPANEVHEVGQEPPRSHEDAVCGPSLAGKHCPPLEQRTAVVDEINNGRVCREDPPLTSEAVDDIQEQRLPYKDVHFLAGNQQPLKVDDSEVIHSDSVVISKLVDETRPEQAPWEHVNLGREDCRDLPPWFRHVTDLQGHEKGIVGIALPPVSNKLYTGSRDGIVRVWDCNTAQCIAVVIMGGEIGCMIGEGPWVFVGVPKVVQAWNTQTGLQLSLGGPTGQVNALEFANELLFAGLEDGLILAWKSNAEGNSFQAASVLVGHLQAIVCLIVGAMRLYSGSVDETIRVWDLKSLECIHMLKDHTSVVTSLLCWDQYLLSCSLDRTIKVWATSKSGGLEVIYTHSEEHGVMALRGLHDGNGKPVIICSCDDHSVHLFELPSFCERGNIFFRDINVGAIQGGPCGLFFTGDERGEVKVWKCWTSRSIDDV